MTAPPQPKIHIYKEHNIYIEYIETQDIFPYIVNAHIDGNSLSDAIRESIEIINYRLKSEALWDEEIELPNSIDKIMDIAFNAIITLYDNDEKGLSISLADYFFNNYAIVSWNIIRNQGSKNLASEFLEALLLKTKKWENRSNRLIHKGTPYYFLTSIYLAMNDIDSGFASMFKAIDEDKRNKVDATHNEDEYKKSAAYKYASLIDDRYNYLYQSVIRIRNYLSRIITDFNSSTIYNLTIEDIDKKFLNNDNLEELKFLFVYLMEKYLIYLAQISELKISNEFYELRNSSNLFDLCIIIDKILENKYENKYRMTFPNKNLYLGGLIWCLFDDKGWITGISHAGELKNKLSPNILDLDPERTFHYITSGSVTINGVPITNVIGCMLLVWRLRNWSAHTIKKEKIFVSKYEEIFEKLIWSFLIAVESL